jgi:hypothetical protein
MKPPTVHQIEIAAKLGIDISGDSQAVAAARIREQVELAIRPEKEYRSATSAQINFGKKLCLDLKDDSIWVASAKLQDELDRLNRLKLEELQLKAGDPVIKTETVEVDGTVHTWETEYIVSSIGKNGRVYFKGGNGRSARPSQLRKPA